jgi:CRISP-associated protein Cas1
MKKYLNTLFVTTQGAYLNKEGESVVVSVDRTVRLRIPVHTLGGIVCFGNVLCSPFLMRHCAEHEVLISFLSENGRFLARVHGPVSGNVLLRRQQYRMADNPEDCVRIARSVLLAKAANSRTVLQRAVRDHAGRAGMEPVDAAVLRMGMLMRKIRMEEDLDALRGREGDIGRLYFSVFDNLLTAQKDSFFFHARSRRPPLDAMNALLSFIYTLLAHDCASALEAVGLDPQVGFLHRDRPGRPSLALDLMEEFRPFFADRLALSLVNLRQVQADGFKKTESGAVEMDEETRKTLLVTYQKRKQDEMTHPFVGESASLGLFFHLQAQLLARHIRGDLDTYPPVLQK